MMTVNHDNSRKTNSELKEAILYLFEQVRQANARNAEKDRMIASLTDKMDAVLENQRQQRLDLDLAGQGTSVEQGARRTAEDNQVPQQHCQSAEEKYN